MNIAVNNVEEKAVHSWSRISSAGQKVLEEALRVFNPMSKDLSDTETQLVAFIQGLKEEGYQPTILRSKDVYGYSSCTADTPNQAKESTQHVSTAATAAAATASDSAKTPARNTAAVAKVPASSTSISVNSSKVSAKPVSKSNSTNLLLNSLKQTRSGTSKASAVGFPANMYPDVYPAMRLSVVLEALVPLKTTASCLESKYKQGHLGISPSDLKLLKASSPPRQSSSGKSTKITEAKGYKRLKKGPDCATLTLNLLKGPKGGVLQESNACKASGVLNGRVTGSSSKGNTVAAQSKALKIKAKEAPLGKMEWKDSSSHQETVGQKRKRATEVREAPQKKKKTNTIPVQNKPQRAQSTLNLLKFQAIKVDNSSDDEVRRRAQKILRVNLSPVIRIQPLSHSHSVS
ncbi:coiled-coil domain-containing protein 71 [Rhea pennata]|uniref:coiled-coil domain-containing protein 71 n=1 Tax=Rhea pennata TaxID=8795 RepID=UPI002E276483